MPIFRLDRRIVFPPAELAEPDGLLAVGGDLSPERLMAAYQAGIFPWYDERTPILWHSPDPRAVLLSHSVHVPKSLAKMVRRGRYEVRLDTCFKDVMARCAHTRRPGQSGTWITSDMFRAYVKLHELGFAHSAEAFDGDRLVGGLYGVSLGGCFFGESMFASAPDASKVTFVTLCAQLARWEIDLVDCQVQTDHLDRFGAELWPRERFLAKLGECLERPTRPGPWSLDEGVAERTADAAVSQEPAGLRDGVVTASASSPARPRSDRS